MREQSSLLHAHESIFPLLGLYIASFLLRISFGGTVTIFTLFFLQAGFPFLNIEIFKITFLVAEILFAGYFGFKSDEIDAKKVILFATAFGASTILLYGGAGILLNGKSMMDAWIQDPQGNLTLKPGGLTGTVLGGLSITTAVTLYLSIAHFLHGVASAAKIAPTLGYISRYSVKENMAWRMSLYDFTVLSGRVVGIVIGGVIYTLFGISDNFSNLLFVFFIYGFILFLSLLVVVFFVPNAPHTLKKEKIQDFSLLEELKTGFREFLNPERRDIVIPWLTITALLGYTQTWGIRVIGIIAGALEDDPRAGVVTALLTAGIVLSLALPAPFWGKAADKYRRKNIIKVSMVGVVGISIASGLVLFLPQVLPWISSDEYGLVNVKIRLLNPISLAIIYPWVLLIAAFAPAVLARLGNTAHSEAKGSAMSAYHLVLAVGEIIGVILGGLFLWLGADIFESIGLEGHLGELYAFAIFAILMVTILAISALFIKDDDEVIIYSDSFCPACGASISKQVDICPVCDENIQL